MGGIGDAVGSVVGSVTGGMYGASGSAEDQERQRKENQRIADEQQANQVGLKKEGVDAANTGYERAAGAAETGFGRSEDALGGYAARGDKAGASALKMSQNGFSFGAKDFQEDPAYKFQMQQGLQATQNSAGVRGSPFGGAAQREMAGYASDLANKSYQQQYQNKFQAWQAKVGNLQQLAGLGGNAAQGIAGAAGTAAGQTSTAATAAGGQSGSAIAGQAANDASVATAQMGGDTSTTNTGIQTKVSFMDFF